MKNKIIKIVVLSVVLLACLSIVITVTALSWNEAPAIILNMRYKDADTYAIGEMEYGGEQVSHVKIDYYCGAVKLVKYDGETVKLEEEGADSEKNTVRSKNAAGTLLVQYGQSGVRFFERLPNKTLTLYIPRELLSIEIETASATVEISGIVGNSLKIEVASGNMTVTDSSFREVEVESASGGLTYNSNADEIEVETASGSVALVGIFGNVYNEAASGDFTFSGSANRLELDSASGDTDISGEVKSIEIDTASGDVSVYAAPLNISLESASGDVTVRLPKGTSGVLASLETASGEMEITKDGTSVETRKYSDGAVAKHTFEFETASGDVNIVFEN